MQEQVESSRLLSIIMTRTWASCGKVAPIYGSTTAQLPNTQGRQYNNYFEFWAYYSRPWQENRKNNPNESKSKIRHGLYTHCIWSSGPRFPCDFRIWMELSQMPLHLFSKPSFPVIKIMRWMKTWLLTFWSQRVVLSADLHVSNGIYNARRRCLFFAIWGNKKIFQLKFWTDSLPNNCWLVFVFHLPNAKHQYISFDFLLLKTPWLFNIFYTSSIQIHDDWRL